MTILIFIFITSILLLNDMGKGGKYSNLWKIYGETQRREQVLFFFSPVFYGCTYKEESLALFYRWNTKKVGLANGVGVGTE